MLSRDELFDDERVNECDRRARHHGPARALRAVAYFLVELADEADVDGDHELESYLRSASDDLEYAAEFICDQRPADAQRFLVAAVTAIPELGDAEAIADALRLIRGMSEASG